MSETTITRRTCDVCSKVDNFDPGPHPPRVEITIRTDAGAFGTDTDRWDHVCADCEHKVRMAIELIRKRMEAA